MIRYSTAVLIVSIASGVVAQAPSKPSASEIFDAIKKTQVLGSVLYVAAHPDDENTRLISYFANEEHYHTTYLSLTRGDGGQNLIGTEIGSLLGLIRTQELLKARNTDGGNQMFSRAIDFGYSKTPQETFSIWNKEDVLADVIWSIRKTRPDIIVHRFDHRREGITHGHHTGSAQLSFEAFSMTNDPTVYPDQLEHVAPWQATRQFFNTSWFFYGSREAFEKADKSNMVSVDVGVYYPSKGLSNNEIAAASRSFHKSQGFGATGSRGSAAEYIELIQGAEVSPGEDPFKGINTTWSRVEGGTAIGIMLAKIEEDFAVDNPSNSIKGLVEVYRALDKMESDNFWVPMKKQEIKQIIVWCGGFFAEAVASDYSAAPGQTIDIDIEMINRSDADMTIESYQLTPGGATYDVGKKLSDNIGWDTAVTLDIPLDAEYTTPYWLAEGGTKGMFTVEDQVKIGLPEGERPINLEYVLNIEDLTLSYSTPLVYKRNDPVKGETYRPFDISPSVFLNFHEETLIFGTDAAKDVNIVVKAGANDVMGSVALTAPRGWTISPSYIEVALPKKGQEMHLTFTVTAPDEASTDALKATFTDKNGKEHNHGVTVIEYDHIPTQTILKPASTKIVRLDLVKEGNRIGYVMGAGDKVPEFLSQVGYDVTMLTEEDLATGDLQAYDAIIIGIRAYNTNDRLKFFAERLFEFVSGGGNMIVQYNTSRGRIDSKDFSPYPLKLSRDRVTDENAEVRIIAPDHPAVQGPNAITQKDFDGWVQERGLYFPNEWDQNFTPILSSNDPGETPKDGALLVAPYGKGWYIYSGISWFRELPAGVPGAYRLLANLISLRDNEKP